MNKTVSTEPTNRKFYISHKNSMAVMGRIKTKLIKRITLDLYKERGSDFKDDFEENKSLVAKYVNVPSNKLRNIIAGYITRLVRTKKEF